MGLKSLHCFLLMTTDTHGPWAEMDGGLPSLRSSVCSRHPLTLYPITKDSRAVRLSSPLSLT